MTLRQRCGGVSPSMRDISSRTAGTARMDVAVANRIGQETISATTTTPLS